MSLMLGAEIGFKLATRQLIYILNPCHVTTAFQVRGAGRATSRDCCRASDTWRDMYHVTNDHVDSSDTGAGLLRRAILARSNLRRLFTHGW